MKIAFFSAFLVALSTSAVASFYVSHTIGHQMETDDLAILALGESSDGSGNTLQIAVDGLGPQHRIWRPFGLVNPTGLEWSDMVIHTDTPDAGGASMHDDIDPVHGVKYSIAHCDAVWSVHADTGYSCAGTMSIITDSVPMNTRTQIPSQFWPGAGNDAGAPSFLAIGYSISSPKHAGENAEWTWSVDVTQRAGRKLS